MTGADLTVKIVAQYGTANVFDLIQSAGITLVYAHWHPTTMGEFHKKTKTIYVNLNAGLEKEQIIAHELGHYFMDFYGVKLSRLEEEMQVEEFVKRLFLLRGCF